MLIYNSRIVLLLEIIPIIFPSLFCARVTDTPLLFFFSTQVLLPVLGWLLNAEIISYIGESDFRNDAKISIFSFYNFLLINIADILIIMFI